MERKLILIVEDDVIFRETLTFSLKRAGFEVLESENGAEALKRLEMNPEIGLVISDVRMPVMDGVELLKAVRSARSPVAFILMTGYSDIAQIEEALNLGADTFMTKPFKPKVLLDSVHLAFFGTLKQNVPAA